MAHPTLSALKTQKTVAAVTRGDYFSNLTKTESQFKISFLNFFHFFLHHNTSWYIVVLGRRKNPTLFWASFGKLNFLTAAESAANASEQAKQALRQFLNCSLWFAGDKIISKDLPGCFAMQRMWIETPSQMLSIQLWAQSVSHTWNYHGSTSDGSSRAWGRSVCVRAHPQKRGEDPAWDAQVSETRE